MRAQNNGFLSRWARVIVDSGCGRAARGLRTVCGADCVQCRLCAVNAFNGLNALSAVSAANVHTAHCRVCSADCRLRCAHSATAHRSRVLRARRPPQALEPKLWSLAGELGAARRQIAHSPTTKLARRRPTRRCSGASGDRIACAAIGRPQQWRAGAAWS